jgi:hypothetical protein
VEYCDTLIFHRRAALDQLGQRLLDANRTIGQPSKITTIFGRNVTKCYKGMLQTVIEDLDLPDPVIRTHYAHGSPKQSSNSSNAFTHRWLQGYFGPTGQTPNFRTTNEPPWIASTKKSQTISMNFFMLLASRLPEQREQSSRQNSHKGLTH